MHLDSRQQPLEPGEDDAGVQPPGWGRGYSPSVGPALPLGNADAGTEAKSTNTAAATARARGAGSAAGRPPRRWPRGRRPGLSPGPSGTCPRISVACGRRVGAALGLALWCRRLRRRRRGEDPWGRRPRPPHQPDAPVTPHAAALRPRRLRARGTSRPGVVGGVADSLAPANQSVVTDQLCREFVCRALSRPSSRAGPESRSLRDRDRTRRPHAGRRRDRPCTGSAAPPEPQSALPGALRGHPAFSRAHCLKGRWPRSGLGVDLGPDGARAGELTSRPPSSPDPEAAPHFPLRGRSRVLPLVARGDTAHGGRPCSTARRGEF